MFTKPVGTAIIENSGLPGMSSAVSRSGLKSSLDQAASLTVMVPTERALTKMPNQVRDALERSPEQLKRLVRRHVVEGKLTPQQILGDHITLDGKKIYVTANKGDVLQINGSANVVCGNIATRNAVVYIIDAVLE